MTDSKDVKSITLHHPMWPKINLEMKEDDPRFDAVFEAIKSRDSNKLHQALEPLVMEIVEIQDIKMCCNNCGNGVLVPIECPKGTDPEGLLMTVYCGTISFLCQQCHALMGFNPKEVH